MAASTPNPASEDDDAPQGVFGNLPASRPGSRSPRRRGTKDEADSKAEVSEAAEAETAQPSEPTAPAADAASPATGPPSSPDADADTEAPEKPEPVPPQPGIHGVEDLAWAGVAVAAQVATAGIRFTSRALEAARKSIDRP